MEIIDSACVPTFSFPLVLDCHQYYELIVPRGEGRSPMTSSDAETDSKPIIIIIGRKVNLYQIGTLTQCNHLAFQKIAHPLFSSSIGAHNEG